MLNRSMCFFLVWLLIASSLICYSFKVEAQKSILETGTLSGYIYNQKKTKEFGAFNVYLVQNGEIVRSKRCKPDSKFQFENLSPGYYQIETSAFGQTDSVCIEPRKTFTIELILDEYSAKETCGFLQSSCYAKHSWIDLRLIGSVAYLNEFELI